MGTCPFPLPASVRSPRLALLAAALLTACLGPLAARALPVGPDTVLVSGDGRIEFSEFAVFPEGAIGPEQVAALDFSTTGTGLSIEGPLSLVDGAEGAVYVMYEASVRVSAIAGVTLAADTAILDGGFPTFAKTEKLIFAGDTPELLNAADLLAHLRTRNFADELRDEESSGFARQGTVTVLEAIRLSSGGPGGSAVLFAVRNEFTIVPEPGTALSTFLGVAWLAWAGRRR